MKFIFSLLSLLTIHLTCLAQNHRPPGTKFYVLAHPEQLQLYMANDATQDIFAAKDSLRHLVVIYITSGDGLHAETGAKKKKYDYKINEAAARSAIEIISNTYEYNIKSQKMWMSDWETDKVVINGHRILQYQNKNITCYFLRLPTGEDISRGQLSLEQLYEGKTKQIAVPDTSTAYDSWEDVVATIREIMRSESSNTLYAPWLNTIAAEEGSTTDDAILNKYVSLLATEAFNGLPQHGISSYFRNLHTSSLPANMPAEYIAMQAAMMAAYDFTRSCAGESSEWESNIISKAGKTYKRIIR